MALDTLIEEWKKYVASNPLPLIVTNDEPEKFEAPPMPPPVIPELPTPGELLPELLEEAQCYFCGLKKMTLRLRSTTQRICDTCFKAL